MNIKLTDEIEARFMARGMSRDDIKAGILAGAIKGLVEPSPSRTTWIDDSEIPKLPVAQVDTEKPTLGAPIVDPEVAKINAETAKFLAEAERNKAELALKLQQAQLADFNAFIEARDALALVKANLDNEMAKFQKATSESESRILDCTTKMTEVIHRQTLLDLKEQSLKAIEANLTKPQREAREAEALYNSEIEVYKRNFNKVANCFKRIGNKFQTAGLPYGKEAWSFIEAAEKVVADKTPEESYPIVLDGIIAEIGKVNRNAIWASHNKQTEVSDFVVPELEKIFTYYPNVKPNDWVRE